MSPYSTSHHLLAISQIISYGILCSADCAVYLRQNYRLNVRHSSDFIGDPSRGVWSSQFGKPTRVINAGNYSNRISMQSLRASQLILTADGFKVLLRHHTLTQHGLVPL